MYNLKGMEAGMQEGRQADTNVPHNWKYICVRKIF